MKTILLTIFFLAITLTGCRSYDQLQKPQLFITLPDYVTTPDGMAAASDSSLVVACPNFADQSKAACLIKVGRDGRVQKWIDVPILAETGVACPMGIDFGDDGDIYICDNQGWSGKPEGQFRGRILRIKVNGNQVISSTIVAEGMEHPNGIRIKGDYIFVTQSLMSKVKDPSGLLVSAVYKFSINDDKVMVSNTLEDKNIIATFITYNKFCQYGVDGIVFDSKGNLFTGNFGDGAIYKIAFGSRGNVSSNNLFAKTGFDYSLDPSEPGFLSKSVKAKMRTTDGICVDREDNIYVADFSNNAIAMVTPSGKISVIAQNGDTDGLNGELDQPGEPIIWNDKIFVTNFDIVTGPDKVNSGHELPATISTLKLK